MDKTKLAALAETLKAVGCHSHDSRAVRDGLVTLLEELSGGAAKPAEEPPAPIIDDRGEKKGKR